jgi:PPOX class probable F420-dependent enzyme
MTNLDDLGGHWAVLLTTFRRDGSPVGTPVSLAVAGDRGYVRSPGDAWKVKRLRHDPRARLAPCTPLGRPTGPAVAAVARRLEGDEERRAARLLRRRHPVLQGVLVPVAHRMLRCGTAHYELRLDMQPGGCI